MTKSLVDYFEEVEDPRQASGLRHPLVPFMCMSTMAVMSGYAGFREIAEFMNANLNTFRKMFELKHGVPKHVQVRTIFSLLNFDSINQAFKRWAAQFLPHQPGQWVCGDGKSLNGTLVNSQNSKQDFVIMVSLFVQETGIVLLSERKNNGKGGEIPALERLLDQLQDKGMIITLDALHCKKKP